MPITTRRSTWAGFFQLLLTTILITALAGCGSDSGYNEREDFVVGEGSVQFVNMMPDSPTVVMLHGIQNSNVRFPYAEAPELRFEDRYDWRIAYLNNSNDDVTVIEGEDQVVSEDVLSTFLFLGTLENPSVEVIDTPIIATADRPEGISSIWFASNVSRIDMVDIYLTEFEEDISTVAPLTTLTSGTFTGLIDVPSGATRQMRIYEAGTDNLLFDSGSIIIVEKAQELFALVDDFGPDAADHVNVIRSLSVGRTLFRDVSQPAGARIGNFSSTAQLDVSFAGTNVNNVPSGNRSGYFNTGFGEYPYVSSDDDTVLEETKHTMQSGEFSTIYNFDDLAADAETPVRSVIIPDSQRPVAKRALLKFVNGSNDTVDVYVLRDGQSVNNSPPFLSDAPFAGSVTSQVIAVNLDFIVRSSSADEEFARISSALAEGKNYTLLFTPARELLLLED